MRCTLLAAGLVAAFAGPVRGEGFDWEVYLDARLRGDLVTDLPRGRDDLERVRFRALGGIRWFADPRIEIGAAIKVLADTESDRDSVANLDNEEADDVELGELYFRYLPGPAGLLELGRAPLPLRLGSMLWDADLRPIGFSYQRDWEVATFDRLTVVGGYFTPHHIDETESRLTAVQARYHWHEGAPRGGSAALSYLEFSDLAQVTEDLRTRTNRLEGGRLAADFEILDLLLEARAEAGSKPLVVSLDLAKNLGVDREDGAARMSVRWGDARRLGGLELGIAWQRVQRDAVMAAFNDDDWWFPSANRGLRPWISYGFSDRFSIRTALFRERMDGLDEHLHRLIVDLLWTY